MTTVYFVRHAESDYNVHMDEIRPLTSKGMKDTALVTNFLRGKDIHKVISSPYKRAIDTIRDFADKNNMDIIIYNDFRERKIDSSWIEDFRGFSMSQWADFNYKLSDGESLREVQDRNIQALHEVLNQYEGKNIVIGSHGTALSTIIHYYDNTYGFKDFDKIIGLMPWIVKFTFDGTHCMSIEKINVFLRND